MEYKYDSSNPFLLESVVCFTDILGFSSLIMQSPNRQHGDKLLKNLHSVLMNQYRQMKEMNPNGHFKTFTDNVILAYPKIEDGEGQSGSVFMSFIDYQLDMILNSYFLRGGIALGNYYGDDDFAYGPALIKAYNLECKEAKYPRIILSKEMIKMVMEHLDYYGSIDFCPQYKHLLEDEDGAWFINYLYGLNEEYEFTQNIDLYIQKLLKHKDIIIAQLNTYKNNNKLYPKYEWVAQYHNYYCDQYFNSEGIQELNLKIQGVVSRKFSRII